MISETRLVVLCAVLHLVVACQSGSATSAGVGTGGSGSGGVGTGGQAGIEAGAAGAVGSGGKGGGTAGAIGTGSGGAGTGGTSTGGAGGRAVGGSGNSGTGGSAGGAGGMAGGGGNRVQGSGGYSTGACGDTCTPGAYCEAGCIKGGRSLCNCYLDTATGMGRWGCSSQGPCGSNACGTDGTSCNTLYQTSCDSCDGSGNHQTCACSASGSPSGNAGKWTCGSSAGSCGVSCGDRHCLAGEICINRGQYPGIQLPDAGVITPTTTPTCVTVPDACAGQAPTCANCIIQQFGCSVPGVCRDLGPQTFDCILGGA